MSQQITNEIVDIPVKKQREDDRIVLIQPTKIKLGYSFNPEMGIGVFATDTIIPGEIIERCPMVQLAFRGRYHNDPQISRYLYTNRCGCQQCGIHGPHMYMVLGYGMLYNHQNEPNTEWKFDWGKNYADVIAVKHIEPETEIFVSYGNRYFSNRPYFSKDGKDKDQYNPEEKALIEN